jgi:hypothetical protein
VSEKEALVRRVRRGDPSCNGTSDSERWSTPVSVVPANVPKPPTVCSTLKDPHAWRVCSVYTRVCVCIVCVYMYKIPKPTGVIFSPCPTRIAKVRCHGRTMRVGNFVISGSIHPSAVCVFHPTGLTVRIRE